jgi:hypothetical protein
VSYVGSQPLPAFTLTRLLSHRSCLSTAVSNPDSGASRARLVAASPLAQSRVSSVQIFQILALVYLQIHALDGLSYVFFVVFTLACLAVFIAGWNFSFATRRESVLWRSATLMAVLCALAEFILISASFQWHPALRCKLKSRIPSSEEAEKEQSNATSVAAAVKKNRSTISTIAPNLKNNSVFKDPALNAPVEAILAMWFFGFFYVSARAYIFIADFMELHSLPRTAHQDVNWSAIWPHI